MRGLTDEEARVLRPYGPPGEFAQRHVFDCLIERGLAYWAADETGLYFRPTELGELALRLYDGGAR